MISHDDLRVLQSLDACKSGLLSLSVPKQHACISDSTGSVGVALHTGTPKWFRGVPTSLTKASIKKHQPNSMSPETISSILREHMS